MARSSEPLGHPASLPQNASTERPTATRSPRRRFSAFLAGKGPLTRHRENKYHALAGFWRYAISRGYATRSPLPDNEPRSPRRRRPTSTRATSCGGSLTSTTVEISRRGAVQLDAVTFRTLLLLLYGAGLRFGEATASHAGGCRSVGSGSDHTRHEVLQEPSGSDRTAACHGAGKLHALRRRGGLAQGETSFLLANRDGTRLASSTVQAAFDALRRIAGIHGAEADDRSPRLHDLRHSFAVHSLTAWYRQGADVQRLLPVLSTYLGHSDLEGTKVYLSMTPELLQQASLRFARYAGGGGDA